MTAPLDLESLKLRTREALLPRFDGVDITHIEPLQGGASSLTYVADVAGAPFQRAVVKVAPPGLEPVRNRDVLRQARVLDVLRHAPAVAVPEVLGTDVGSPPEVPPLFVMTFSKGESFEPISDEGEVPPPNEVEGRSLAAAHMLAEIHRFEPGDQLADERVFTLEEEVQRWVRAFSTVTGDLHPTTVEDCSDRLLGNIPTTTGAAILHGDYRLGNMLCEGTRINALIDWEIWSLNDPRIDLAWFLLMSDPNRPGGLRSDTGTPSPKKLREEYEKGTGTLVTDLDWFAGLVRFKQAATSALIVKNNRKMESPNQRALSFADRIPSLLTASLSFL